MYAHVVYVLDKTPVPGYETDGWVYDGGVLDDPRLILAPGENVTCTFTNDDIQPQLKVINHVVNDDGGTAVPDDFQLNVTGAPVTSGVT